MGEPAAGRQSKLAPVAFSVFVGNAANRFCGSTVPTSSAFAARSSTNCRFGGRAVRFSAWNAPGRPRDVQVADRQVALVQPVLRLLAAEADGLAGQ
jgi:hypothetical protein